MIVFEEVDVEVDGAAEESREVGDLSYVVDYQRKIYVYLQEKNNIYKITEISQNKIVHLPQFGLSQLPYIWYPFQADIKVS